MQEDDVITHAWPTYFPQIQEQPGTYFTINLIEAHRIDFSA